MTSKRLSLPVFPSTVTFPNNDCKLASVHSPYMSKWSIGWCVHPDYRNQNLGMTISELALKEFENKMGPNLPSDFYIEACVDAGNIASKKIAKKLIGNEENVNGKEAYSYLREYKNS